MGVALLSLVTVYLSRSAVFTSEQAIPINAMGQPATCAKWLDYWAFLQGQLVARGLAKGMPEWSGFGLGCPQVWCYDLWQS
jgi:hypothetical protein